MKRILFGIALLAVAIGVTWQLGTSASQQPAPPSATQLDPEHKPIPVSIPDCPIPTGNCFVQGCSPAGDCTTIDLGSNKCKESGGGFFDCPQGLTVQYTRCACTSPCSHSISQLFCQ